MNNKNSILLLLLVWLSIFLCGAQTVFYSKQLAPSPTDTYVLTTNGKVNSWDDPASLGASPGGADTNVQYNDSGSFKGEDGLVYIEATDALQIGSPAAAALDLNLIVDNAGAFYDSCYVGDLLYLGWSGVTGDYVIPNLYFSDADGDYVALTSQAMASSYTITLPAAAGTVDEILYVASSGGGVITLDWKTEVVDTDTDNMAICWDDNDPLAVQQMIALPVVGPHCVPLSGTANYTGIYVSAWTVVDAADEMTVALCVDAVVKDTWTTSGGNADAYGGTVDEALTQGTQCSIRVWVTTVNGGADTIEVQNAICNVEIT